MLTEDQRTALAARLRRGRADAPGEGGPDQIRPRAAGLAELPLSYGQEQLWFLDRLARGQAASGQAMSGQGAYNVPQALRLSGPLDPAALDRALTQVIARHEALRTRLTAGPGDRPVQVIDPPRPVSADLVDLSGHAAEMQSKLLRDLIDVESVRPFVLAAGPLLRAWLVRLAAPAPGCAGPGAAWRDRLLPEPAVANTAEHVLLVVAHHAVTDGWSARLLLRELAAHYARAVGAADDPAAELAALPVQFADYAIWERDRLRGPVLDELAGYWRAVLDGAQTLQFPTDYPRPVVEEFDGGLARRMTDRALLDGLRELSRRQGTTLFVTLMAGLQALLHRYTGQSDITVGTVSANRTRPELAGLIGFLVATLPIRGDLSGDPPFTDLLARLRDTTVAAYAHQDLPFGKLVEALRVERDPGRSPLFQVAAQLRRARGGPGHRGRGRVRAHRPGGGHQRGQVRPRPPGRGAPGRAVVRVLVQDRAVRPGHGRTAAGPPGGAAARGGGRPVGPAVRAAAADRRRAARRAGDVERHRRPGPGGVHARGLRGPGGPHPGRRGRRVRGHRAELRRPGPARQPDRPPAARAGRGARGAGGRLHAGRAHAAGGTAGDLEGRRWLRAARPGPAPRPPGLHDHRRRAVSHPHRRLQPQQPPGYRAGQAC